MAVAEYLVIGGLVGKGRGHLKEIGEHGGNFLQWNGKKEALCGIYEAEELEGNVTIVQAWSAAEAITGFRQLYPTNNSGKCIAVLKSSTTEE